ncbi:MAG: 5-oxoprolinase subunit PxpB, partial [Pseudomonadota bacterium]
MMSFQPFGDAALLINFEQRIDLQVNKKVIQWYHAITSAQLPGVTYCSSAYCSLTVGYQLDTINYQELCSAIKALDVDQKLKNQSKSIQVPVCYESEFAPDMNELSQQTGLTTEEIITLHTAQTYHVYMIGFLPGFAYMGKVDSKLECKRKDTPRIKVPAGSVGLAGMQTGIYPSDAPGGWQIIGQTPWEIFNPNSQSPCRFQPGDQVTFYSVTESEFLQLKNDSVFEQV